MRCWVMDDYLQTARCCTNSSSPASSHTNLIAFPAACCDQEGSAILSLSYDFCCSPSTGNIITNHYSNLHPNTLIWLAQTILCEIWIKLFIKLYSNVIDSKFSASCLVRCAFVHENLSHRLSRHRHGMSAEFLFFASHFTNSNKDGKVFASLSWYREQYLSVILW